MRKNLDNLNINVTSNGFTKEHSFKSLDIAIRYAELAKREFPHCEDATIVVNGIFMPNLEDETFFYASVEAAKEGKVWCEECHTFVDPIWKNQFESGCFDSDDDEEKDSFWKQSVDNVYADIFGYTPVTGEEGQAIVYDETLALYCKNEGYDVLPCVKDGDDGEMVDYWLIFPKGGEEEYFTRVYCDSDIPNLEYSSETYEYCFYGDDINAFYDTLEERGSFHLNGWYTRMVSMPYEIWKNILNDILENPENYNITNSGEPYHTEGELLLHRLEKMPFDVADKSGFRLIHATGWEVLAEDGKWHNQYDEADGE